VRGASALMPPPVACALTVSALTTPLPVEMPGRASEVKLLLLAGGVGAASARKLPLLAELFDGALATIERDRRDELVAERPRDGRRCAPNAEPSGEMKAIFAGLGCCGTMGTCGFELMLVDVGLVEGMAALEVAVLTE